MNGQLKIRLLQSEDITIIADAFTAIGWNKPASQYERYLAEQEAGDRVVLVALINDDFAGYVTIEWHSGYQPFAAAGIPEIADFNVLPHYRRRHIGSRLLDEAERRIGERSAVVGIGVGLYPDYGPAQRMYVLRGYIPDGLGVAYNGHNARYGQALLNDDSLALYFTKQLRV